MNNYIDPEWNDIQDVRIYEGEWDLFTANDPNGIVLGPIMKTYELGNIIQDEYVYVPITFWQQVKRSGFIKTCLCRLDEFLERIIVPPMNRAWICESKNRSAVQKYNFVLYTLPWWWEPLAKIEGKLAKINRWMHQRKINKIKKELM